MANKSKEEMLIAIRPNPNDAAKDVNTLETETDASSRYHAEKTLFNKRIWALLRRILYDLLLPETRKASASCFQIYTTAYQAGVDGLPTTFANDRLGEISASADLFCVKNAYTALELVIKFLNAIEANRRQPPAAQSSASVTARNSEDETTTIDCQWANAGPGTKPGSTNLETSSLDEIFSIVIPLSLSSTFASMSLARLIAIAGSETNDEDPILQFEPPSKNFRALITVSTADFQVKERSPNPVPATSHLVVIVCGGIATPFAARNRIAGVDPFQITIFSWIIATFVILTSKSRYAAEWPWHEILHGHVVCRSIKEVCDASGISAQTILMYLLLNERDTVLRRRGPYNGIFARRTPDSSAFTINEPTHISNTMASGFIALKVLNAFGELLVCLDIRSGSDFITLLEVAERLVHEERDVYRVDLMVEDEDAGADSKTKRYVRSQNKEVKRLMLRNVRVDRVLGVYSGDTYFG